MAAKRLYHYIGPEELFEQRYDIERVRLYYPQDVLQWIRDTGQRLSSDKSVTATFVVDGDGALWISDRHTEHVACANGRAVQAAGEMTFQIDGEQIAVANATNQSTGYAPDPNCWPPVSQALEQIGIEHPGGFDPAYVFRRCKGCSSINIIKDDWFVCSVCGAELSRE